MQSTSSSTFQIAAQRLQKTEQDPEGKDWPWLQKTEQDPRGKDWPWLQKTEPDPEGRTDLEGVDESDDLRKEVGRWDAACIFSVIFHHPRVGVLFENTEWVLKIQTALKTQKQGWKQSIENKTQCWKCRECWSTECAENTFGRAENTESNKRLG